MLTKSQKFEIRRKIWHIINSAFFILTGLYIKITYGMGSVLMGLLLVLFVLLFIDYLRVDLDINIPVYQRTLRKSEEKTFHALTYSFIASIIIFAFFKFDIAFAALVMAVTGDAAAAIFGIMAGGKKIFKGKTYAGSFAGGIIFFISGYLLLFDLRLVIPMALTAALVESFTDKIDDNFAVPLFTAAAGQAVYILLSLA